MKPPVNKSEKRWGGKGSCGGGGGGGRVFQAMREWKGEMGERRVKDERYFVKILPSIRSRLSNRDLYPDVTERASGEALLAFCKNNETEKKELKKYGGRKKKEALLW